MGHRAAPVYMDVHMRKRCAAGLLLALLLAPLGALDLGTMDLGFSLGMTSHYFEREYDDEKLAFSYGLTLGLSDVYELDVTGTSELIPDFLEGDSTVLRVMLSRSMLGERSTGTYYSGIGINTLVGFGMGFSTFHEGGEFYPTHLLFSVTPVTVGTPVMGKREKLCTLTLAVNVYEKSVSLFVDLVSFDFYALGSWRQHRPPQPSDRS